MNKLITGLAGVTIISAGVGIADPAAAITFNFSGSQTFQDSLPFEEEGFSLTATAGSLGGQTGQVTRNSFGLGVLLDDDENNRIDGDEDVDSLILDFSNNDSPFLFQTATLTRIDAPEEFSVSVNGVEVINELNPDETGRVTVDLGSVTGQTIAFSAVEGGNGYRVEQLTGVEGSPSEAIPEPLTILGTGAALGFGAFFKKNLAGKNKKEKNS